MFVLISNKELYIYIFWKNMDASEFMDFFPYVSWNWLLHEEASCKQKLKKIKYTYIEWFSCHFSRAHIMKRKKEFNISVSIIFMRNVFIWSLEILCSIARNMNREKKENGEYPNGVAITHNLNQAFMGLLYMYFFAPCFQK